MPAFKLALKVLLRNPVNLIIYGLALSFLGVFVTFSICSTPNGSNDGKSTSSSSATFAVIDRDGSQISEGMRARMASCGTERTIGDTTEELQDAIAKGKCAYVLIIPAGYGAALMEEAHGGEAAPALDYVYGYYSMDGAVLNEAVGEYVSLVRSIAMSDPLSSDREVRDMADNAVADSVVTTRIHKQEETTGYEPFIFYLGWSIYPLFAGITTCVLFVTQIINRSNVRNRSAISSTKNSTLGIQKALACAVIGLAVVVANLCIGFVFFGTAASCLSGIGLSLCLLAVLCFAAIPLSLGFFLGELGVGEAVGNVIANIAGMGLAVFGGVWISFDILSSGIETVARFLPGYWYVAALESAANVTDLASADLALYACSLGILLLFAAVFVALGLVASRINMQTSDAGGNAGAQMGVA